MKVLKYVLGSLLILSGINGMLTEPEFPLIIVIILGGLILPPVSALIVKKLLLWSNKIVRYATYAFLLFILGVSVKPKPAISKQENEEIKPSTIAVNHEPEERDDSNFWKEFDPIVKDRIYEKIEQKDCNGLQEEFNTAADNMDKMQANGGSGSRNLALLEFLDEEMKKLDCYK